jgi:hypothetical protein
MKNIVKLICVSAIAFNISGCGESNHPSITNANNGEFVSSVTLDTVSTSKQPTLAEVTRNLKSPAFGGVDGINGVSSPKAGVVVPIVGDKVEIAGVYVDAINADAAAGVLVLIDDKVYETVYGGERADIAKALNNPKYLKSQFYASIPTAKIGVGQHDVKIRVIASDRSGYYDSDWTAKFDIK